MHRIVSVATCVAVSMSIAGCGLPPTPNPTPAPTPNPTPAPTPQGPTSAPTPSPTPAPTPPPANISAVFAKHLELFQLQDYQAIAETCKNYTGGPGLYFQCSECYYEFPIGCKTTAFTLRPPDAEDMREWMGSSYNGYSVYSENYGGPNLTMQMLVDVEPFPKLGFAIWEGRSGRPTRYQRTWTQDLVRFDNWGTLLEYHSYSFQDRDLGSIPFLHRAGDDTIEEEMEMGSAITIIRDRTKSAWTDSDKSAFQSMFAEDAQVMVFNDCAKTDNVGNYSGAAGPSAFFDDFLAHTSPGPTNRDLARGEVDHTGMIRFLARCKLDDPDRLCYFSMFVVTHDVAPGEPRISFMFALWMSWYPSWPAWPEDDPRDRACYPDQMEQQPQPGRWVV